MSGTSRRVCWVPAFGGALLIYLTTLAPGLLWGDAGIAQLHTALDGWLIEGQIARSHVLYYAITRTLDRLTSLDPARATNVASALGGALTVANACWCVAYLSRRRLAVVCAFGLLTLSHTLWRLSTSAEVLTLTTALLTTELILWIGFIRTDRRRWLAGCMLMNGLGVANHNFALLMWPVYLYTALRYRHLSRWRARDLLLTGGPPLLLGMTPILILVGAQMADGQSVVETGRSWLFGRYGEQMLCVQRSPLLALKALATLLLNYPTPVLLLGIVGLSAVRRRVSGAVGSWFLGALGLLGGFGGLYDVPDQYTFLAPALVLGGVLCGVGVDRFLRARRSAAWAVPVVLLSFVGPVVYAMAPAVLRRIGPDVGPMPTRTVPYRDRYDWFLQPWLTGYDGAERFAMDTLTSLPENAWLVIDSTLFPPVNYVQAVHGTRRDVRIDWRSARQPWLPRVDFDRGRREALAEGRMFAAAAEELYLPVWMHGQGFRFEPHGPVFRVLPPVDPP